MCENQSVERRQEKQGFRNQDPNIYHWAQIPFFIPTTSQVKTDVGDQSSHVISFVKSALFNIIGRQSKRLQLGPEADWERGGA